MSIIQNPFKDLSATTGYPCSQDNLEILKNVAQWPGIWDPMDYYTAITPFPDQAEARFRLVISDRPHNSTSQVEVVGSVVGLTDAVGYSSGPISLDAFLTALKIDYAYWLANPLALPEFFHRLRLTGKTIDGGGIDPVFEVFCFKVGYCEQAEYWNADVYQILRTWNLIGGPDSNSVHVCKTLQDGTTIHLKFHISFNDLFVVVSADLPDSTVFQPLCLPASTFLKTAGPDWDGDQETFLRVCGKLQQYATRLEEPALKVEPFDVVDAVTITGKPVYLIRHTKNRGDISQFVVSDTADGIEKLYDELLKLPTGAHLR